MSYSKPYRISAKKKDLIAQNLIGIVKDDEDILDDTVNFIYGWTSSGPEGKTKAFYDVWDIVLRKYLPTERPILFRSCMRVKSKREIVSFTGSIECARNFSLDTNEQKEADDEIEVNEPVRKFPKETGLLLICDTKVAFWREDYTPEKNVFSNSFYPLKPSINKIIEQCKSNNHAFSIIQSYLKEDEYIMRLTPGFCHILKWRPQT